MKKLLLSAVILFIAWAVSAEKVSFPVAVAPLRGDILGYAAWDFSQNGLIDDNARTSVCSYGDSLLSEIYEGRRYWYNTSIDTLSFLGEEDRLTSIVLAAPAHVASTPLDFGINNAGVGFEARGEGAGRRFDIRERGRLEFASSTRPGVLILSPGDTIENVLLTRERRHVTATFPDDSLSRASHLIVELYRWYDIDGCVSLIPIALQRTIYKSQSLSSDAVPSSSVAYLPETAGVGRRQNNDDCSDKNDLEPDAIEAALETAVITCDGRTVSVSVDMPQSGLTLSLDIVDAAGRLYLHESCISSGATDEMSLDCSGLRAGQYLAVVSVENITVVPKKKLVIIRGG